MMLNVVIILRGRKIIQVMEQSPFLSAAFPESPTSED
jgi:hypothetical protein